MAKRKTEYVPPIAGADAAADCLRECFILVVMLHQLLTGTGMAQGEQPDEVIARMVRLNRDTIESAYKLFVGPADQP